MSKLNEKNLYVEKLKKVYPNLEYKHTLNKSVKFLKLWCGFLELLEERNAYSSRLEEREALKKVMETLFTITYKDDLERIRFLINILLEDEKKNTGVDFYE